ncbi:YciI family protein [Nocardioides luteus]|uniref:YciI family protein n=1 Tax=Nocardioides luteus TaxID=1844 RepID=UPI0018C908D8|nr:YciI family protein [Nocardioides luteus]MBG6099053.1 uncharacterized protein YciI [Nocardioides luteus]
MSMFIVRFEHPNEEGWLQWVRPHVEWVQHHVAEGVIVASGPSVGTDVRQGWLVIQADDEASLRKLLMTDPFWGPGIIENMLIVEWDPIFGELAELSSAPEGFDLNALP